jgi:hypothetical protein
MGESPDKENRHQLCGRCMGLGCKPLPSITLADDIFGVLCCADRVETYREAFCN